MRAQHKSSTNITTSATLPDDNATVLARAVDIENIRKTFASLVIVQGVQMGKQFVIRRNSLVIGRADSADICVQDKRISRFHAKISLSYNPKKRCKLYMIEDLGSTNHVYVNGRQVREGTLQNGDKIQVGDSILKFEIQDRIDSQFHADIQRKIKYDDLTALLTYDSFKKAVEWELDRTMEKHGICSIVMMDLDDFKAVNDTHGHLAGSFVLKEMGLLIRAHLRHYDISARYGGEEFVTCMPESSGEEAFRAAERLRAEVASHVFVNNGAKISITISMGIAQLPDHGRTLDELVRAADSMLYKAKSDGKNRVYVPG